MASVPADPLVHRDLDHGIAESIQNRLSPVALFLRSWLSAAVTTARSKAVILNHRHSRRRLPN